MRGRLCTQPFLTTSAAARGERGWVTTLSYGNGNRLATLTDAARRKTASSYNRRGQMLTAKSPEVTYSYCYDAALRLAGIDDTRGNKSLAYRNSPGGRLTRLTIDYRYDSTGKLAGLWDSFDTLVEYAYDAVRLKQRFLGNGSAAEFTWNADGTLAQRKNS